jgi:hypothetical protein
MQSYPKFGLLKLDDGTWSFTEEAKSKLDDSGFKKIYLDSTLKYLGCFSPAFEKAKATSEFEFILSLLRVRGVQDTGWDPYETTAQMIPTMVSLYEKAETYEAERHLQLWIYGHIVEASEPYEILMNMVRVARGFRFKAHCFPSRKNGAPQSPGEKIRQIKHEAVPVGLITITTPLEEIWNREFRNAIFHSDYSFSGKEVRTTRPLACYSHEQIMTYVNKALAYHEALERIYHINISSYREPKMIDVHPGFARRDGEKAWVMVRENYGVIGLRDTLEYHDEGKGMIQWKVGRFSPEEFKIHLSDKKVFFPASEKKTT